MMLVEYECDDSNGPLAAKLIPVGCDPEEWPTSVQYVQYAGERKGGGSLKKPGFLLVAPKLQWNPLSKDPPKP